MQILRAAENSQRALVAQAARCIGAGGTIIFPTETVYGIGAGAEDDAAICAVYAVKGRSFEKPLALHIGSVEQAQPFVACWTTAARRAIDHFWPGPLAIVLTRQARRFEKASAGRGTISLRFPNDALARAILCETGPLAATSANRSGEPAFTGSAPNADYLPAATLAIIAGPTTLQRESTIMDCSSEKPRVVRWGAIERAALESVFGTLECAL